MAADTSLRLAEKQARTIQLLFSDFSKSSCAVKEKEIKTISFLFCSTHVNRVILLTLVPYK